MVSWCFPFNTDVMMCLMSITAMAAPGCLIRVSLQHALKENYILIPSLLPNLCGSFIMGFHEAFAQSRSDKYVKVGIATGLCGSITTFSSFNFEINRFIIRHGKPRLDQYVASIAATFIGGIIAYYIGEIIAVFLFHRQIGTDKADNQITGVQQKQKTDENGKIVPEKDSIKKDLENNENISEIELEALKRDNSDTNVTNTTHINPHISENPKKQDIKDTKQNKPNKDEAAAQQTWHLMDDYCILLVWTIVCILMYAVCIPCSFLIHDTLWESIVASPFGALSRWYLGKVFNGNVFAPIPFGTFIANIIGSILFNVLYVLSGEGDDVLYKYHEMGLGALMTGFCGCFTTVSSFVHEKFKLKRETAIKMKKELEVEILECKHQLFSYKFSVLYFFLTLIVGQICSSVINAVDLFA